MNKLEHFNLGIERIFHKLRNLIREKLSPRKQQIKMEDTLAHVGAVGVGTAGAQNEHKSLMEYAYPSHNGTTSCIRRPIVQANNFKLKPFYV